MEADRITDMLAEIKEQQLKLEEQQARLLVQTSSLAARPPAKDRWDRLAALAPIASAVIIAVFGACFTYTYNEQQLKLQQIQTLEKFIPHLTGSEKSKRAAILAIQSLGNTRLAAKVASIFASEGTVSALQSIARTSDSKEKAIISGALSKTLDNLAERYAFENKYGQAVAAYKEALSIKEASQTPNHAEITDNLLKLAALYESHGDRVMAAELRKRAGVPKNASGEAATAAQPDGAAGRAPLPGNTAVEQDSGQGTEAQASAGLHEDLTPEQVRTTSDATRTSRPATEALKQPVAAFPGGSSPH
jgi:hypothetical protein